jgi:hypothetical protein
MGRPLNAIGLLLSRRKSMLYLIPLVVMERV